VDPTTIAAILNPASGAGKTAKLIPKITELLKGSGRPHELHITSRAGEAPDVAKRFAESGAAVVLAVGGDGTINEVANGLIAAGGSVPIGLVPSGHGSDFVRTTGTPKQVEAAFSAAISGRSRQVDAAKAVFDNGDSRHFVNFGGTGFDAVVARFASGSKLPGSTLPYVLSVFRALAKYQNVRVKVTTESETIMEKAVFVSIANARYLGGGMLLAPMADLHDGYLDLAIIGDFGKFELVRQIPSVFRGKHTNHPKFRHIRAKSVRIECETPVEVQLDGELCGTVPVTVTAVPGALRVAGL
jgi:YegS/Rv2252/BmrU family lipid kinase